MPNLESTVPAEHGQKTIAVRVKFFTDELAPHGQIIQKHGWTAGGVSIAANEAHGIASQQTYVFNSLNEIPTAIEKVLIAAGVTLHPSRRMQKLIGDVRDAPETSSD